MDRRSLFTFLAGAAAAAPAIIAARQDKCSSVDLSVTDPGHPHWLPVSITDPGHPHTFDRIDRVYLCDANLGHVVAGKVTKAV
jgi:hypothetical protein